MHYRDRDVPACTCPSCTPPPPAADALGYRAMLAWADLLERAEVALTAYTVPGGTWIELTDTGVPVTDAKVA